MGAGGGGGGGNGVAKEGGCRGEEGGRGLMDGYLYFNSQSTAQIRPGTKEEEE